MYNLDSYLPESLLPVYESVRSTITNWLTVLQIIPPTFDNSAQTAQARSAHSHAQSALNTAEKALKVDKEALQKLSDGTYGPEGEWKKLEDMCLEKDTGDYTYSVCLFGAATQKSNNDHATHNLG